MKKDTRTMGQKVADKLTDIGGSWRFVVGFSLTVGLWTAVNSLSLGIRHFDEFPFIFLNLILSCLAAVQAPVIMMSQKRQNTIDREMLARSVRLDEYIRRELNRVSQKLDNLEEPTLAAPVEDPTKQLQPQIPVSNGVHRVVRKKRKSDKSLEL